MDSEKSKQFWGRFQKSQKGVIKGDGSLVKHTCADIESELKSPTSI